MRAAAVRPAGFGRTILHVFHPLPTALCGHSSQSWHGPGMSSGRHAGIVRSPMRTIPKTTAAIAIVPKDRRTAHNYPLYAYYTAFVCQRQPMSRKRPNCGDFIAIQPFFDRNAGAPEGACARQAGGGPAPPGHSAIPGILARPCGEWAHQPCSFSCRLFWYMMSSARLNTGERLPSTPGWYSESPPAIITPPFFRFLRFRPAISAISTCRLS